MLRDAKERLEVTEERRMNPQKKNAVTEAFSQLNQGSACGLQTLGTRVDFKYLESEA